MIIYPIFISIVWGFIPIILKLYLLEFPYISIVFFQSLLVFLCALFYILLYKYEDFKTSITKITFYKIIIFTLTFITASFICNLLYLSLINKDVVIFPIIIFSLTPLITIIAAYLFLNKSINYLQLFGLFFIIIGVFFMFYYKENKN